MALKNLHSGDLDFQSSDEAWYNVNLALQGETLIVKYCNFSDDHDEHFSPAGFKDLKEVECFATRFRPTSVQLQDNQCKKVIEGNTVCASYVFAEDNVRFYDAVVEEVNIKDHKFGNEEECTCTFVLFWLSGPNGGNKTEAVVANICLLQHGNAQINPIFSRFIEICRDKFKVVSRSPARVSEGDVLMHDTSNVHNANIDSFINNKKRSPPQFASPVRSSKEVKVSISAARTSKVRSTDHPERTREDIDLGGRSSLIEGFTEISNFKFLLIDNLEKDLAPSAIVDFVRRHLSISSKAQVFPSLSTELYTKGIIMVDSPLALQKLSDFLNNPSHMVLSSKGRPWVITDTNVYCGTIGVTTENLTMFPDRHQWDKGPEVGDKLRIVSRGTREYERGRKLKDIFLAFTDHLRGLHQQLALEESKILQSSNVPWTNI